MIKGILTNLINIFQVRNLTTTVEKLTSENELLKEKHRALEEQMKMQDAQREQYAKSMEAQVSSFSETIKQMTIMMQARLRFYLKAID